jgi:hypothetical protein
LRLGLNAAVHGTGVLEPQAASEGVPFAKLETIRRYLAPEVTQVSPEPSGA